MKKYDLGFEEMEIVSKCGKYMACWEWIGEGKGGDYDEEDPNDVPLLRFSCHSRQHRTGVWEQIDDTSYCTRMPIDTDRKILTVALQAVLDELVDNIHSPKKPMEFMSWLCPEDVKKV